MKSKPKFPRTAEFVKSGLFDQLTSIEQLERRIAKLPTGLDRGDAFEAFAEAYFATQPVHAARNIWPDKKIPPSVRSKLKLPARDKGVDGVFETILGEYWAYQVKFSSRKVAPTWTKLSTFIGLADRVSQRVLFTNSNFIPQEYEDRINVSSVRGTDLEKLRASDFREILAWLKGAVVPVKKVEPRAYQRAAVKNMVSVLRKDSRATAVMACGTGKTLTCLWAAEALKPRLALVLLPSLALVRQTLHEWLRQTRWDHLAYLCVCSDLKVAKGSDALVVHPAELDFRVTTDSRKVREFLQHKYRGVKVVFSTYQSAQVVAEGMRKKDQFDIGIFDEAHRTAGREGTNLSFALHDGNLSIRKRLFVTATPRHYDLSRRTAEGDVEVAYSMDDTTTFGPLAYELRFAEAVKRKVICPYKVIISVVTNKMLDNKRLRRSATLVKGDAVRTQQVANQLAVSQALRKSRAKKVFTFHSRIPSAESFTSTGVEGIGSHVRGYDLFFVKGSMNTALREGYLNEFKDSPRAIMSNAKCLTEGVDVPSVDMVAFMSPKRSRIDIVQATGRAMRKAQGKTTGYVLVPLYVEQRKGESLDAAVERTGFDAVWYVLQALQEHDSELDAAVHRIAAVGPKIRGITDRVFDHRVEVIGPRVGLATLRRAVQVRVVDRLARPWDTMVEMLQRFGKKHRHLRVPVDAPAPWTELGLWVDRVRALKRTGKLSDARQVELDKLAFCWRVDGQTLDSVEGLLNEKKFILASGLTKIADYRKQGLIKPVGISVTSAGLSAFYEPQQITELKEALGITLDSVEGLLNENEFKKRTGLSRIADYRSRGLIKPVGFGLTTGGVTPFYHPRQIDEVKKELGITLESTEGLLNEDQFRKTTGFTRIERYRKNGLIKPVGFGMSGNAGRPFYHPRQEVELRKALGITLKSTEGLLNEKEFIKASGLTQVRKYRTRKLIKPVGVGMSVSTLSFFYHPRQIAELKKKLGITLKCTEGLLNAKQFIKASGLTNLADYSRQKLIKPIGFGITKAGVSPFYHPRQIAELKKKLGITLESTEGLLGQKQFAKASGLSQIGRYTKQGLIKPVGYAVTNAGVSAFYHPRQIAQLQKTLGITLKSTKGLLSEAEFKKRSRLTGIAKHRERGAVVPAGYAMTAGGCVGAFYYPRQIAQLKKKLGITLTSTKGLLNENEFRKESGLYQIAEYRSQGLIKPVGRAMTSNGKVGYFYHRRQIAELKKTLDRKVSTRV